MIGPGWRVTSGALEKPNGAWLGVVGKGQRLVTSSTHVRVEHHGAFGVNATGLGVGTISKFVTARLGFRARRAAAAKTPLHTA